MGRSKGFFLASTSDDAREVTVAHDGTIFPVLLNDIERLMLDRLSTESGMSRSAVVRELVLKEMAARQLPRASAQHQR